MLSFAKVLVNLDVAKSNLTTLTVDLEGEGVVEVEVLYENIPCLDYLSVGHLSSKCLFSSKPPLLRTLANAAQTSVVAEVTGDRGEFPPEPPPPKLWTPQVESQYPQPQSLPQWFNLFVIMAQPLPSAPIPLQLIVPNPLVLIQKLTFYSKPLLCPSPQISSLILLRKIRRLPKTTPRILSLSRPYPFYIQIQKPLS